MSSNTSKNATKKPNKCAVMFSGGWDSLYCLVAARKSGYCPDLLFFDYGQSYLDQERAAVCAMGLPVITVEFPPISSAHGVFDNRNLKFLEYCATAGYSDVYFGCRNVFPFLDRYGDSNWWFGKQQGRRLGITVHMPATAKLKRSIISTCRDAVPQSAKHVFSTEGLS